jgi:deoxyadenosine/deoxycytidine kinase
LEQGLRLPAPGRLTRICEHLGIPASLWEPYTATGLYQKLSRDDRSLDIRRPRFIAVAGMIGSGKTTLARKLSRAFSYPYVPENVPGRKYLSDLRQDPSRWAFEAQLSFLAHKATQIADALRLHGATVLDRSISEDINVFARHFHSKSQIEDRAFSTYLSLGEYLEATIPSPDLVIYCRCPLQVVRSRVAQRSREDQAFHSPEFLSAIFDRYIDWVKTYAQASLFEIDSERVDFRDDMVVHQICREIENTWSSLDSDAHQLDMFSGDSEQLTPPHDSDAPLLHALSHQLVNEAWPPSQIVSSPQSVQAYPLAYIAAPFTALATDPSEERQMSLALEKHHGQIGKGKYRRFLLHTEKSLNTLGVKAIIPHRDINKWGKKQLSPDSVMRLCTDQVKTCDLFVGLPGQSHGSHYEFGVARGMGKPCIVIHCDEISESFISKGAAKSTDELLVLTCARLGDIPKALQSQDVRIFLRKHLPITEP